MAEIDTSLRLKIRNFAESLLGRYNIKQVILYGSYAEGTNHGWSDIDLAIVLDDSDSHGREIFGLGKDWDIRFDALSFLLTDFEHSRLPVIPEIKKKGIRIL